MTAITSLNIAKSEETLCIANIYQCTEFDENIFIYCRDVAKNRKFKMAAAAILNFKKCNFEPQRPLYGESIFAIQGSLGLKITIGVAIAYWCCTDTDASGRPTRSRCTLPEDDSWRTQPVVSGSTLCLKKVPTF